MKAETCQGCHQTPNPENIRIKLVADYDGDGDATEGIFGEVETLTEKLYEALKEKSVEQGNPLVYDAHAYPYFFNDTNANGTGDTEEINVPNGYKSWTPRLLKAAYNLQYAMKDPGAYAHNGTYILQVLYDAIQDVGGDLTGLVRP